jgi:hypothetical protein
MTTEELLAIVAICNANIAAMQSENSTRQPGEAPAYPGAAFFIEAASVERALADYRATHDKAVAEIARRKSALVATLQAELVEYVAAQARRVAPTLEWAATRVGATTARGHHTLTRYEDGEWSASIGGWTGRGPTPDAAWAEAVRLNEEEP